MASRHQITFQVNLVLEKILNGSSLCFEKPTVKDTPQDLALFFPISSLSQSVADKESEKAEWMTLEKYGKIEHLRGNELLQWGEYVERGGTVYPLSALATEWDPCDMNPHVFTLTRRLTASALHEGEDDFEKYHERLVRFKKAVTSGDAAEVTNLLDKGMDVNARFHKRWTPLHNALYSGHDEVIAILLAKGADVFAATHKGRTVVHFAACSTADR